MSVRLCHAHLHLIILMQAPLTQLKTFSIVFTRAGHCGVSYIVSCHTDVYTWVKQRLAMAATLG